MNILKSCVKDSYDIIGLNTKSTLLHNPTDMYVPFQGRVSLTLRDSNGNILHEEDHNEIVYIGRHRVARIMFGSAGIPAGELNVNTLKIAGGAVEVGGDHFSPKVPVETDPGIFETELAKIKTFSFDVPTYNDVSAAHAPLITLTKTILCTEVDMLINEFGAFFGATGPMFAHYTCSTLDLRKDAGTGLEIVWQFIM